MGLEFERVRYHLPQKTRGELTFGKPIDVFSRGVVTISPPRGAAGETPVGMTLGDVKRGMLDRSIRWGEVPSSLLNAILTRAAGEIVIDGKPLPPALLDAKDLTQRDFKFLGGRKLNSLYYHFRSEEAKKQEAGEEKRDVMSVILEKAGIQADVEDIRTSFEIGRRITWERVPPTTIRGLLEKVAEENEIPASLLSENEMKAPSQYLHGNNLDRLYQHVVKQTRKAGERDDGEAMTYLLTEAGLEISYQDLEFAVNHEKMIRWERVSQGGIRTLMRKVSTKIGKPAYLWVADDFSRKFEFLNSKSLGGLYAHIQRFKGEKSVTDYLYEMAGSRSLWAKAVDFDSWDTIPYTTKREMLELAAKELEKPTIALKQRDLDNAFTFLIGRNLTGLFANYQERTDDTESRRIMDKILNDAHVAVTVEDVKIAMNNNVLRWERVPHATMKSLLDAASEELGIPPMNLTRDNLKTNFSFLDNHSLYGMYQFIYKTIPQRAFEDQETMGYIYDKIGFQLTLPDLIEKIKSKSLIRWSRVPDDVFNELISKAAESFELPPSFLSATALREYNFRLLDGNTLGVLYAYAFRQPREQNETPMAWIRKKAGITEPPVGRRNRFRFQQMERLFYEKMPDTGTDALLSSLSTSTQPERFEPFMSWIDSVTTVYKRFFYFLPRDAVRNEIITSLAEESRKNPSLTLRELLTFTHVRVEKAISVEMRNYYSKKALETPIGTKNRSQKINLEGTLEACSTSSPGGVVFSRETESALARLSPVERFLVEGITVDGRSIDTLINTINSYKQEFHLQTDLDIDTVQELYEEALVKLRGFMTQQASKPEVELVA